MTERRTRADDAQNVSVVQASADEWNVVVTETESLVGRVVKEGELYHATDALDRRLGSFPSRELAVFGVVNPDAGP